MDSSGRLDAYIEAKEEEMFQSFCVNGFLWKFQNRQLHCQLLFVSILLCQWIPLEEKDLWRASFDGWSFNPSVSMDSSGSRIFPNRNPWMIQFQSFCVNGFLWKFRPKAVVAKEVWFQSFCVNGFLWKNRGANCGIYESYCFNPSVSMDSSGSEGIPEHYDQANRVSILLCQWIPLEVLPWLRCRWN